MERVCCMCGDVGFSDKLFRCFHCRHRFQHSYCSNYYSEFAEPTETCDWCRSDEPRRLPAAVKHGGGSSKKSSPSTLPPSSSMSNYENGFTNRSEYSSGDRVKQNNRGSGGSGGGAPSPRTATRRYKLLKDVMC